jgi:tetratricopeptide (TPR) repeat protein
MIFRSFRALACLFALLAFLSVSAPVAAEVAKSDQVPFRTDSGLITAEYYLATGKYTQALDVLGGVLQRHPQNPDAYAYRGYAYHKLGDLKKARENYNRAIALYPTHLGANKYLADIYLAEGNLPKAMEQLQVILYVCAGMNCGEADELQGDINRYKANKNKD